MRKLLFVLIFFFCKEIVSQKPTLVLPVGHTSLVTKTIFSPKARYVLTASWDKTARLWNPVQQKLLHTFTYHTGGLTDIAFNYDESTIALGSADSSFSVWDIPACKLRFAVKLTNPVTHIEFDKYQKELLVHSGDSIQIFNLTTGKKSWQVPLKSSKVKYSTDYKYIICNSSFFTDVILFDNDNKNTPGVTFKGHKLKITGFEITELKEAVSASLDSMLIRWNISGKVIDRRNVGFPVTAMSVSDDGNSALLTGNGGNTELWDIRKMEKIDTVPSEDDIRLINGDSSLAFKYNRSVFARFIPNRKEIIVSADNFKKIQHYTFNTKLSLQKTYISSHTNINDITVSPNGKNFILSGDQISILFDTRNVNAVSYLWGHTSSPLFIKSVLSDSLLLVQSPITKVELWDMREQKLRYTLASKVTDVQAISCSPSEKTFASISQSNQISIWNTSNGNLIQQINLGRKWIGPTLDGGPSDLKQMEGTIVDTFVQQNFGFDKGKFSNDEKLFTVYSSNSIQIPILDLKSNKLKLNVILDVAGVDELFFSPDSKWLAILCWHHTIALVNIEKQSLVFLEGNGSRVRHARFNREGTELVSVDDAGEIYIWNLEKGEDLSTHTLDERPVALQYSNDGYRFFAITKDAINVYDAYTHKKITVIPLDKQPISNAEIQPGNNLLLYYLDGTNGFLNLETGIEQSLSRSVGKVNHASVTQNGSRLITETGSILTAWGLPPLKKIVSFFSIDSASHFSLIRDGYYQASPESAKLLHYVTKDLKVISFEQLDVKYNRPDKVLEAIGSTDTALIKSYRKAWQKRVKKLGIDTTTFQDGYSLPESDFTERDNINYEHQTDKLTLRIKGKDSVYKLDRFNIWINDVPVFGQNGINIKYKKTNFLDTTITLHLSQGENRIETSILNINGIESYRIPLYVKYTPLHPEKEKIRFVGIGIDTFASGTNNLQYSVKDIRNLTAILKQRYKENITIDTLFNEKVTLANVRALKKSLQTTAINDKVVLSYSGHGLLNKEFDYFLSTYPIDFANPEKDGLAYEELENLLDNIPARKKLMLIDACHSGEVDKEEKRMILALADSLPKNIIRGFIADEDTTRTKLGLQNSFELMQSIFVNVGKHSGTTVISAAAGTQFALEKNDLQNGVFTYSILEALEKNSSIKISDLRRQVGVRVQQLTNGMQKPTSRSEILSSDWEL